MTTWPFVPTRPVILDEYNDLEARYGAFGPPVSVRERIPPLDIFPVVTPDADEPDGSAVGGTSEPLAAPPRRSQGRTGASQQWLPVRLNMKAGVGGNHGRVVAQSLHSGVDDEEVATR